MRVRDHALPFALGAVAWNLAAVLRFTSFVLTVPAAVGLLAGEWRLALLYAAIAASTFAIGALGWLGRPERLDTGGAHVVTALAFAVLTLVGAFGFLPVMPYPDGVFEAMSGFTTTGLTLLDLQATPRTIVFFRAYAQWLGGAAVLLLFQAVVSPTNRAAVELLSAQYGKQRLADSLGSTSRGVLLFYLALTAVAWVALLACGLSPWDALLHDFAAISTGGFSPHRANAGHYPGAAPRLVLSLLMLVGASSFARMYEIRRAGPGRLLRDPQFRSMAVLVAAGTVLLLLVAPPSGRDPIAALFHVVSALTTTGFALDDAAGWPDAGKLVAVLLMAAGGAAGSTAGGLKQWRLVLLVRAAAHTLLRPLLPAEARLPLKYEGQAVGDEDLRALAGFTFAYLALLALSVGLFVGAGHDPLDSTFECISALATVGLQTGVASPDLEPHLKLVLTIDMWAGRVEIFPVLLLLYPYAWGRGRRPR